LTPKNVRTVVKALDGVIGALAQDSTKTYGRFAYAVLNAHGGLAATGVGDEVPQGLTSLAIGDRCSRLNQATCPLVDVKPGQSRMSARIAQKSANLSKKPEGGPLTIPPKQGRLGVAALPARAD
jgi:hypothetical protein